MQRPGENNSLYQNLLDTGCGAERAKQYEKLAEDGKWSKLLRELSEQKKHLLSSLHESEKQIDCLDFLVYEIKLNPDRDKGEF